MFSETDLASIVCKKMGTTSHLLGSIISVVGKSTVEIMEPF